MPVLFVRPIIIKRTMTETTSTTTTITKTTTIISPGLLSSYRFLAKLGIRGLSETHIT